MSALSCFGAVQWALGTVVGGQCGQYCDNTVDEHDGLSLWFVRWRWHCVAGAVVGAGVGAVLRGLFDWRGADGGGCGAVLWVLAL